MNTTEKMMRTAVRQILSEENAPEDDVTRRPGRGGYKKSIGEAGALAKSNPQELMNRLEIKSAAGNSDIKKLANLFGQAVGGVVAMKTVYGAPSPRKDKKTGYEGIRIPVQLVSPRDARKYLEHTLIGAQNARTAIFDANIQVEILGSDVLIYFSDRPYSWGRPPKAKKKKPAPKPSPTETPS